MAWQTPKTDWGASDGVRDSDFNRIEGNIAALYDMTGLHNSLTVYVNASSGNDNTGTGSAAAPYKTISKALSVMQRVMGQYDVTLDITGSFTESVTIRGFTAPLTIHNSALASVQSMLIDGCAVLHSGGQLNCTRGLTLRNGATYTGYAPMYVGTGTVGVSLNNGSTLTLFNTFTISNTTSIALEVSGCSRAYISAIAGTNNATGVLADTGGVVAYGSMSLAAVTQRVTNTGGRIYSGAQSSTPNY